MAALPRLAPLTCRWAACGQLVRSRSTATERDDVPAVLTDRGRRPPGVARPVCGDSSDVLLQGVDHVACLTRDPARLGAFYAAVFDAEIGPTERHGEQGEETMTVMRIGPHTELNVFVIPSSDESDRQTPMWHRGRLDHLGLRASSYAAFATIRERLIEQGGSDGTVNDFGSAFSMFFRDPDGLEGEVLVPKAPDGSHPVRGG